MSELIGDTSGGDEILLQPESSLSVTGEQAPPREISEEARKAILAGYLSSVRARAMSPEVAVFAFNSFDPQHPITEDDLR